MKTNNKIVKFFANICRGSRKTHASPIRQRLSPLEEAMNSGNRTETAPNRREKAWPQDSHRSLSEIIDLDIDLSDDEPDSMPHKDGRTIRGTHKDVKEVYNSLRKPSLYMTSEEISWVAFSDPQTGRVQIRVNQGQPVKRVN